MAPTPVTVGLFLVGLVLVSVLGVWLMLRADDSPADREVARGGGRADDFRSEVRSQAPDRGWRVEDPAGRTFPADAVPRRATPVAAELVRPGDQPHPFRADLVDGAPQRRGGRRRHLPPAPAHPAARPSSGRVPARLRRHRRRQLAHHAGHRPRGPRGGRTDRGRPHRLRRRRGGRRAAASAGSRAPRRGAVGGRRGPRGDPGARGRARRRRPPAPARPRRALAAALSAP